jgi:hypothetical protein
MRCRIIEHGKVHDLARSTAEHVHVLLGHCYGVSIGYSTYSSFLVVYFVTANSVYALLMVSPMSWKSLLADQRIHITKSVDQHGYVARDLALFLVIHYTSQIRIVLRKRY